MKPSIQTLGQILYSPSQYVIPVFQRYYRWERRQWAQLWDSLTEIQAPGKRGNHFMGFLVFVPGVAQPGQHTTFHLIDGQQRLATASLFLAAIRNVARLKRQEELAQEIHEYYLTHPLKRGDQHYRLLPKELDHDSYLSIVNGSGEPTGRMADAIAYFEEQVSGVSEGSPERLRQIFDTLCQRLEFMCATLEAENAYNIFKSLNSTGVPLGQSDLIRNFVFMHVAPEDHDHFDRDHWSPLEARFSNVDGKLDEDRFSRFLRDFLTASGRYVSPTEAFATFEARYEATGFSPTELARALTVAADDYLIVESQSSDPDSEVSEALAGLNLLESSTTYPLLLSFFKERRNGTIDSSQLAQATNMLRGFILRRFICGETSRGYGQMFARALGRDQDDDPISSLKTYLLDRGWPEDDRFERAFVEFSLYERGYTREVLETLEHARGHKEPAALGAAQIEHILPQTLTNAWIEALGPDAERIHSEWLHRPGNLTLSGYNLELWNHPFEKKRERYAQSNIVLTRELAGYGEWTEREIQSRGQQLAKVALTIWTGPKERYVPPKVGGNGPRRQELRQRFWSGLSDYLVTEYPELPDFVIKPSWTVRLPSGVRHIGFELRLALRQSHAGIDIWFWREASFPVWRAIRDAPASWNTLIGSAWEFDQVEGRTRARMFLILDLEEPRNEASWPEVYRWIGVKLVDLYEKIVPRLREEIDRQKKTSLTGS